MNTVPHTQDLRDLVQRGGRWVRADPTSASRDSDGPDSTKVRPTPAGSRVTQVTDHDRCQLAAVQYTALQ